MKAGRGPAIGVARLRPPHEDQRLINNRQNGRRRGRGGGQRPPNNMSSGGNRQDNRQRGNAAQLHEKYKALARDAQLAGDRVQTEYYLQFADHYFRVLNEGRARFEEQRRQRDDFSSDQDEDQDEALEAGVEGDDRDEREAADVQPVYQNGQNGQNGRSRRHDGPRRDRDRDQPQQSATRDDEGQDEERISLDVLPPAIAANEDNGEAPARPRRRTRKPRASEGDAEIAPAA